MDIKFKKLWLLEDDREVIEHLVKPANTSFEYGIDTDLYRGDEEPVAGTSIMIPIDEDIQNYRNVLLKYLIDKEKDKIKESSTKISKLIDLIMKVN